MNVIDTKCKSIYLYIQCSIWKQRSMITDKSKHNYMVTVYQKLDQFSKNFKSQIYIYMYIDIGVERAEKICVWRGKGYVS